MTLSKFAFLRAPSILSSISKIPFLKIPFDSATCSLLLVLLPREKQKALAEHPCSSGFGAAQQSSPGAVPLPVCSKNLWQHWLGLSGPTGSAQLPAHTAALALSCQAPLSLFLAVALRAAATSVCISSTAKARIPLCCRLGAPGAQPRAPQRGCEQGQRSQPTLPAATGGKSHHLPPKHLRITELCPG